LQSPRSSLSNFGKFCNNIQLVKQVNYYILN
jgi:hypothetical protein